MIASARRPGPTAPTITLARGLFAAGLAAAFAGRDAYAIWVFDSTAPYVARAPLAFELVVEKFVFLQIGSPGAVVDEVRFDLAAPVAAVAGSGGAGSVGAGSVGAGSVGAVPAQALLPGGGVPIAASAGGSQQVVVRGNQGSITLSVAGGAPGGLSNGAGGTIGFDQILIRSDNPGLPAPPIDAAGRGSVTVAAIAYGGLVTDQRATWTFSLANTRAVPGGSYKGQLAFTISMP
ncbi:MAG: hypothetical protein AB7P21_01665 [Lautropia sp.]